MESSNFDDTKNISNFTWGEIEDDNAVKAMDTFDPNLAAFDDFYTHSRESAPAVNNCGNYLPVSPPAVLESYNMFGHGGPFGSTQGPASSSTCFFETQIPSPVSTLVSSSLSPEMNDMGELAVIHYEDGTPLTLEQVFEELQSSLDSVTDPVGKFLRKWHLSACDAIRLNIHHLLIHAPRKPREKYGKRKELTSTDRLLVCRERNREHAKSTRVRKRIFREIEAMLRERNMHPVPEAVRGYKTK
eukprot:gene30237-36542_t